MGHSICAPYGGGVAVGGRAGPLTMSSQLVLAQDGNDYAAGLIDWLITHSPKDNLTEILLAKRQIR